MTGFDQDSPAMEATKNFNFVCHFCIMAPLEAFEFVGRPFGVYVRAIQYFREESKSCYRVCLMVGSAKDSFASAQSLESTLFPYLKLLEELLT
jgi:hypothetical protein